MIGLAQTIGWRVGFMLLGGVGLIWALAWTMNGFEQIAEGIRQVGVAHTVLSTDLGRRDLPPPLDGFRRFIHELMLRGFNSAAITEMTCHNPSRLLSKPQFKFGNGS
jgi:hypothetical protein